LDLALETYQSERKFKKTTRRKKAKPKDLCDLFIRLTLTKNKVFVFVGERKHPEKLYRRGVSLKTSSVRRSLSNAYAPEAKTSAYQNALLASLEMETKNDHECVLLNQDHLITEVRVGNIFIVRKSKEAASKQPLLMTPPTVGILDGITRRFVIRCALQSGIQVREIPLTRHEVFNAAEAFLTNTSWEILPVASLDGRFIGGRIPGPVTVKLQGGFRKKVEEECL